MKKTILCIGAVFIASHVLAFDCGSDGLDPKTAALCAYSRGLVEMSAATLTAELGGPSGDPGPAQCAMIGRTGREFWQGYPDLVGGPNGPPADPWDWPPNRWCRGGWCIVNSQSDPWAEQWHMGTKDEDGVYRGSARAWLKNCAAEIWGGAEFIPPWWFNRIEATERFVWQWIKYHPPLMPRQIAAMVEAVDVPGSDRDGGYRCRTLPCVRLGLARSIHPPPVVPPARWRAFVGDVFWHLKMPTPANIRRAMALELTRQAEEEAGWPNRPTWPDLGPAVTTWRVWSENPPPADEPLCPPSDCPDCATCERVHCDEPGRDVTLYSVQAMDSPPLLDPVIRPEIAPHEPATVISFEITVEFRELPDEKGESVAFAYVVGDGAGRIDERDPLHRGDIILAAVRQINRRGRQVLKVTAGAGCWVDSRCKPGEEPKQRAESRLVEPLRISPDPVTGEPVRYYMAIQRDADEGLVVDITDAAGTELALVEMGPKAAVGPFHVSRVDLGNDGAGLDHGELLTHGTVSGRGTAGYR